jgi:hypothetical protein
MLAPLVVDLLISCLLMMLAGWTYDIVATRTSPSRRVAGCAAPPAVSLPKRIDRWDRTVRTKRPANPGSALFDFVKADRGDGYRHSSLSSKTFQGVPE